MTETLIPPGLDIVVDVETETKDEKPPRCELAPMDSPPMPQVLLDLLGLRCPHRARWIVRVQCVKDEHPVHSALICDPHHEVLDTDNARSLWTKQGVIDVQWEAL